MKLLKRIALIGLVLLILFIVFKILTKSGSTQTIDPKLIVSPTNQDITVSISETGLVEPLTKVEIKSKIPGQVEAISVDEGDQVKAGQILLELDKLQYYYRTETDKAKFEEAKVRLAFAKQTLERKSEEYKSKALSKHLLDEAELEKSLAEIEVRRAELEWQSSRENLEHCQIKSPIDGVVILRGVEIGEMVSPGIDATVEGKPLMTVADLSQLLVKTNLNQIDMSKISISQKVDIKFDALPDKQFDGVVHRISPAASAERENINLFPVEILISGSELQTLIKPGMTADIEIIVDRTEDVLTLPIEAILDDDGVYSVKIFKGSPDKYTIEKREITVGLMNDRLAEIKGGIDEKDSVYIDPKSAAENEMQL